MFGARAGAGEWAASSAAWPTPEPTQPDLGRKGTEVKLRILPPSFLGSLGPRVSLENEVKAQGRTPGTCHIIPQPEAWDAYPRPPTHTPGPRRPSKLPSPPLTPPTTSAQDFCKSHSDLGAADEGVGTGFWLGLVLEGGISLSLSSWKGREEHDY